MHRPDLDHYLSKYSILIADAGPLGHEKLSYLYDNGIQNASHLSDTRLRSLPRNIPPSERSDLLNWRRSLELQFWKSHSYKLSIHQERNLVVQIRKENDQRLSELEEAPAKLESLAAAITERQMGLVEEAEPFVALAKEHGPLALALEEPRLAERRPVR